jgi:hypothetical protein
MVSQITRNFASQSRGVTPDAFWDKKTGVAGSGQSVTSMTTTEPICLAAKYIV